MGFRLVVESPSLDHYNIRYERIGCHGGLHEVTIGGGKKSKKLLVDLLMSELRDFDKKTALVSKRIDLGTYLTSFLRILHIAQIRTADSNVRSIKTSIPIYNLYNTNQPQFHPQKLM